MIFYDDSFIEWTAGPAASGERNLSFSITESPDVVSCTAAVIIDADVAITEAPDVVSVGLSHTVGATWALEANGVIEWPQAWIEVAPLEINLAFAITEAPDTVAMGATVTVAADLAITEAPDTVSCEISHVVGATWTLEVDGVLEWPQAWTEATVPARNFDLAITEAPDIVACNLSSTVEETKPLGGKSTTERRRWIHVVSKPEVVIDESALPEIKKPEVKKIVRKPRKIEVKKYEMLDIPKVISEGWKPKEKYKAPVEARQIEALLPKPEVKKKPEIDFAALERELTEAVKRKRIQEQNDLIMLLAMEEA